MRSYPRTTWLARMAHESGEVRNASRVEPLFVTTKSTRYSSSGTNTVKEGRRKCTAAAALDVIAKHIYGIVIELGRN